MFLGSSDTCDITINSDGISRKHIVILSEGDNYYVIDQGSTNGTFINEERLIPGKKVEFTSFFPVRLGENILVSLLSDEQDSIERIEIPESFKEKSSPAIKYTSDDRTQVIKISDVKGKTDKLINQRDQKRLQTKKSPAKEVPKTKNKGFNPIQILAFVIFAAAIAYHFHFKEEPPAPVQVSEIGRIVGPSVSESVDVKKVSKSLTKEELIPLENFLIYMNDLKCTTDLEGYLCQVFDMKDPYGVFQIRLSVIIMFDSAPIYEEAKAFVRESADSSPEALKIQTENLEEAAAILALRKFPDTLESERFKDNVIFIALFKTTENSRQIEQVIAFKGEHFNELKKMTTGDVLNLVKNFGKDAAKPLKEFYTIY
jgi:hypothetical protein